MPIWTNEHEFMPPQGCDLAASGDKLYSSATKPTASGQAVQTSFLRLNLAIKINTSYGNFTTLCFLVLFWRLQSKIAQIQTVKIFWRSNIPSSLRSFLIVSFYTSCVHDGRRSLEASDWCEFFTVHRTGITRNLQAVRYIFSFYSCDNKFIKVNVKPKFYCSRL